MGKILIVGAGLSGSVISRLTNAAIGNVVIWEKSRGAGGRMSTSRNPANSEGSVDLGAQYISASKEEISRYKKHYEELLSGGLLKCLDGKLEGDNRNHNDVTDYITPNGINSIVKHYLKQSGAEICYNKRATDISVDGKCWVTTSECGKSERSDAVILTIPIPQIVQLQGSIQQILEEKKEIKRQLQAVKYSSRFALGLFYEPGTHIDVPWIAKYIDDDVVRFISIDSEKRGQGNTGVCTSVAIHTGVPFGVKHVDDDTESVCRDIVLPRALKLVPQLPPPVAVKSHKWRFSQVSTPYVGQPGAIVLNEKPLLICAGDAFVKSGFNGCLESAHKAAELILSANL